MEEFTTKMCDSISNAVRKKRSRTFRRPRPDSKHFSDIGDTLAIPTTLLDDPSKVPGDEKTRNKLNSNRKEFNINQCVARIYPANEADCGKPSRKIEENGDFSSFQNNEPQSGFNKWLNEGVIAPINQKNGNLRNSESEVSGQLGGNLDGSGNESKVKKFKVKVGGVTQTTRGNSTTDGVAEADSCMKGYRPSDVSRQQQKQKQRDFDNYNSPSDKSGLKGIPWKDFSGEDLIVGKEDSSARKMAGKNRSGKQGEPAEPVRKSKRAYRKRVLDEELEEEDEDEEIRYLEKLKSAKLSGGRKENEEESGKKRKLSTITCSENASASGSGKDGKKRARPDKVSEDTDYKEDEVAVTDGEFEVIKKQGKESVDSPGNSRRETALTTRQRALQSSREGSGVTGPNVIEFPNGLPPAPPRKQKEKLSELELQSKKAEAAQRRRMQVEKAARESEAEAIRKILGQDSSRKKREDQKKRRMEELAKEKAANAAISLSKCVRTVMGPSGTVVTFPEDMGLPSIFYPKPSSYPPPRESCAGPSCTNPYKYRDSKTNLPLCSLKCYKAIHEKVPAEIAG